MLDAEPLEEFHRNVQVIVDLIGGDRQAETRALGRGEARPRRQTGSRRG